MLNDYYTKLSITLESSGGMCLDEPNAVTTTISTEMSECSVHAWFQLFEQVLAMAGFQEVVIMQGGAQLAFNEARDVDAMRKGFWRHFPLAATVGAVVALELAAVLMGGFRVSEAPAVAQAAPAAGAMPGQISNTRELGVALYTHYLYPLQIAAAILLVAMVAAIALTLRQRKDSKYQNPSEQVRVRAKDRVEIIKMAPVRPAPPAPVEEKQA